MLLAGLVGCLLGLAACAPGAPAPTPTAVAPTATSAGPLPSPTGGGAVDQWGIALLYPTVAGGEEWFLNMDDPTHDPRFAPGHPITRNPDGSWKLRFSGAADTARSEGTCCSNEVRLSAYTSRGYHCAGCLYDQQALAARGYMQDARDWKNVEMTGYVRLNATPAQTGTSTHFVWYNRGGRHTASVECEGTGYKGLLGFDGSRTFDKEQWHPGGYAFSPQVTVTQSLLGRWVGLKYVVYNAQQNGQSAVGLELWLDDAATNHWVRIGERVDAGGWGSQGTHCGGTRDQLITWGGPVATFRWDTATDVDFKYLSVREIVPPMP